MRSIRLPETGPSCNTELSTQSTASLLLLRSDRGASCLARSALTPRAALRSERLGGCLSPRLRPSGASAPSSLERECIGGGRLMSFPLQSLGGGARAGCGRLPPDPFPLARSRCAWVRVVAEAFLFPGGGSFTPARRAFDSPMAIACFVDLAPCFPSRIWSISSRTNSPAWV